MAYDNKKEFPVPVGSESNRRKSAEFLPKYFRTSANQKFLNSTLDQMISSGTLEKISAYYGRKNTQSYKADDYYVKDINDDRQNYQFEPAITQTDELGNVNFFKDYIDYINQVKNLNGYADDHSNLNAQEYYTWSPKINWDKFVNYREYFWLPYGASTVSVTGQQRSVVSTYTVTKSDQGDNYAYIFTPDGKTVNPTLTLYKGQTYKFDISAQGLPFTIKTARSSSDDFIYNVGVSQQKVEKGVIEFTVSDTAPDKLYYGANNDINAWGLIKIYTIDENSELDVAKELIGKKSYTLSDGTELSNGMKINFKGTITPTEYAEGEYYVEGVGDAIQLINVQNLEVVSSYTENTPVPFDTTQFDTVGFGTATSYALNKDYVVINKASPDRNPWSRHNRWIHKSVIEASAKANGQIANVDQSLRARRPIIEFEAGLKLYNFGTSSKGNINLIDTVTTDAMSDVEGAVGYHIDGVELTNGMKVMFTADTDPLVKNKIYEVKFLDFTQNNTTTRQISLVEVTDATSLENETVLVTQGTKNQGKIYWFDGTTWQLTQEKTTVNQAPMFELFDETGISYTDTTNYSNSSFRGNKVFSYQEGVGANDPELGFPIKYLNVNNIGDITFDFNLVNDSFVYGDDTQTTVNTDTAFLKKFTDRTTNSLQNGWEKADTESYQRVERLYDVTARQTNDFAVDVYDKSGDLNDLTVKVFVNNQIKKELTDYTINRINSVAYINFSQALTVGDVVVIKTSSASIKNTNGHYEFPNNLESNTLNDNISSFTLGQVTDHVKTITNELTGIEGVTPGASNLRDFPNATKFGRKFLQHSGPLSLAMYTLLRKDIHVVNSIAYSQEAYLRFKRAFVEKATNLGFDGNVDVAVDKVLEAINKNYTESSAFFQTDMLGIGAFKSTTHKVLDTNSQFYAISTNFDLNSLSIQAVNVYHNGEQLLHGQDYVFTNGFVNVTKTLTLDDEIVIREFDTSNGSHIPATPTKLGLYPKYIPQKYSDTTLVTPVDVIQGHDGSITKAYGDYRDDLILELEKRIYNNIKTTYNSDLLDYNAFIPKAGRTNLFNHDSINTVLLQNYNEWATFIGNEDYTANTYHQDTNSLTWNYSNAVSPTGEKLLGHWRGIYKNLLGTDRPNITPWEIIGFTEKPTWWETTYGPAPYTKENLVLWKDMEAGVVREPNKKLVVLDKYKRPNLTSYIPVTSTGTIRSPFESGYAREVVLNLTKSKYAFGDHSPVETAWRRSSDYPFAILKAFLLHQPAKVIGIGWDTSRVKRNDAGQIVYSTGLRLQPSALVFPSAVSEKTTVLTAGLVNYIYDFVEVNLVNSYADYKAKIKNIKAQIGFKIRGFSNKDKFKLVLDSKSPTNTANIFVPEENYKLIYNTSSAVELITYSALIIEKTASGYLVKGYDKNNPVIKYYAPIPITADPTINVGGVSASYVNWAENKRYDVGQYVKYANEFYAVETQHLSESTFDLSKFVKLVELPIEGGAVAQLRKQFSTDVSTVAYGTTYETVQEVVDVILGYGEYLKSKGFKFNDFEKSLEKVSNWQLSVREFLYWTTQNWDAGSVISLSPSAERLVLETPIATTDNVLDNFYSYGVLKEDGNNLDKNFVRVTRDRNVFELLLKDTINGIYFCKIPVVQKENVCVIDNTTTFNDLIFDPASGYKQDRIKVLGYLTEWDGSGVSPGFIFDEAKIQEWAPFTKYAMSDVVKHKQFYYTANSKLKAVEKFNEEDWRRLDNRPQPSLYANFDYKANQFADFYDLDTDNFDTDQQRMAQHLIGYQPREYLRNIINDDVAQYKFYQGYIREKGTSNALSKLFDALASADKESVDFYEEWGIRKGQYGASDTFDEIEYVLDESKVRLNPQPVELTDTGTGAETDLVYRIQSGEVYLKPENYTHNPFPIKYDKNTYIKTAGPVNPIDISVTVGSYDDLLTSTTLTTLKDGQYVWVGNYNNSWNVFRYSNTNQTITSVVAGPNGITVTTLNNAEMAVGEIFVVNANGSDYVLKCSSVSLNQIVCEPKTGFQSITTAVGFVRRLVTSRVSDIAEINQRIVDQGLKDDEKFWVDQSNDGKWKIVNNKFVFKQHDTVSSTTDSGDVSFGQVLSANKNNTILLVGQPDENDGQIYVFSRGTESATLRLIQVIQSPTVDPIYQQTDLFGSNSKFGQAMEISPEGDYILVGAPDASNLKTEYKGQFVDTQNYATGNIVQYKKQLWRATNQIIGADPSVDFTTFDAAGLYNEATGSAITNMLIGDYVHTGTTTNHLLIRASADQYNGTKIGDKLYLDYLSFTSDYNQDRNNYQKDPKGPFGENINVSTISNEIFTGQAIPIVEKIDEILKVDITLTDPVVGNVLTTDTAQGTVVYVNKVGTKTLIYLKDVQGVFSTSDSINFGNLEIGAYDRVITEDYNHLGGWWRVDFPTAVSTDLGADTSNHLVIYDIVRQGITRTISHFNNSLEIPWMPISPQGPVYNAEFGMLSYSQSYYVDQSTNSWQANSSPVSVLSNKYFIRTDVQTSYHALGKQAGDQINVWFNTVSNNRYTFPGLNISNADTNGLKTINDVWEGYVDVDSQPDNNANFYVPTVGDVVRCDTTYTQTAGFGGEGTVAAIQYTGLQKYRLWIKNLSGNGMPFVQGSNAGFNGTITVVGTPNRLLGNIEQTAFTDSNMPPGIIGNLLVFEHTAPINFSGTITEYFGRDIEYWTWDEQTLDGINVSANTPSSVNRDWIQVYNIPIGEGVQSAFTNQGCFLVYKKETSGQFSFAGGYSIPDAATGLRFGSRIKIRTVGSETVAYIGAEGDGTTNLPGKIYFIENSATKNWWLGIDPQYRGVFENTVAYQTGELVVYNNQLYKATTNMIAGAFDTANWQLQNTHTDFLGYIPNDSGVELENDSTLDQNSMVQFGNRFDIDTNGNNIIANVLYSNDSQKIIVYRLHDNHYTYKQTITAPDDSGPTINFGADISISGDGELIAVGSPLKDFTDIDMGAVYVYKKATDDSGLYSLTQTLTSPAKEVSENFGYALSFSGDILAVTSLKGDMTINTAFDSGTTSFDNEMTSFTKIVQDTGTIHIYEKFDNTLLYAEKFTYADTSIQQFGSNLLVNVNHVYVGMPNLQLIDEEVGTTIDFRRSQDANNWTSVHETVGGIEQPDLTKIKSVFLYNKKTKKVLANLDYIDPIFGKIPGPAEEEIFYKTKYDPAYYNQSGSTKQDDLNHWDHTQVGRLWWDISKAQYYYPYQSNIIFNNAYWNKLFPGATIDIHEWTQSKYTPTQWNTLSASPEGLSLGITGTVSNTNNFVLKKQYDQVAGVFTNVYFYWVKDKTSIPQIEGRSLSANGVSKLIKDPRSQGYKYVTIFGSNKFAIVNCGGLISDKDAVINFRLINTATNNDIHEEYAIVTENLASSKIPTDIETVWFNSLIGYDELENHVPDPELSEKLKYGTLMQPRQSWFKNKQEALKQAIERINSTLISNLIVDEVDLSSLTKSDPAPLTATGLYDVTVDTEKDLQFVGVGTVKTATLVPTIEDGKIKSVFVSDAGKGYKFKPTITINTTTGSGAVIELSIDVNGSVSNAVVREQGSNYKSIDTITVRDFSALVNADSTVTGKWAIYSYTTEGWTRTRIQSYNVGLYWNYADWYDTGYSELTAIDKKVSQTYELDAIECDIGDIVKIETVGTGGWLLLEKVDNKEDVDYTVNYKTVGRQNGTIQFNTKLYDYANQNIGFDSNSFDVQLYDRQPIEETRIILQTVRDSIFVEELKLEYNKLFFASIRYALSEDTLNDWVFKTSFVTAQHNVGDLKQKVTFKNDNLSNYEDYIKEIKPYKSKIREYVSSYDKIEPTNTSLTDFDLPPRYINGVITPSNIRVENNALVNADNINTYPNKHWKDNVGFSIKSINIKQGGTLYKNAPTIEIVGGGGSGATATAYIKNGTINRINVTNGGSGYIGAPTVNILGSTTGTVAEANAVLGDSLVRSTHIGVKFDRTTGDLLLANLTRTETFSGNASQLKFKLKWPMDLRTTTVKVKVNNQLKLRSEYTFNNDVDETKSYTRNCGYVSFTLPPANNANISIEYLIDQDVLQTQDRVNLYYSPTAGMPGKELAQVIEGIDYGGVEVRSIGFENKSGWDNQPFMDGEWDTYDESYEDEVFYLDQSTLSLTLSKTLEANVQYNVYRNGVRVDDPNFGTPQQTNVNAVMETIIGDGSTKTVDISAVETGNDTIIIRKSSSDGSFLPDPKEVDTLLQGGDLAYSTAQGLSAEDINVDGDGFVTPTSSHGPEEFVPGQVLDTLDIQVYDRGSNTGSKINSYNYIGDGTTTEFAYTDYPQSADAVFVSVNNILYNSNLFTVDYQNKKIIFNSAPANGNKINFITMGNNGESVLDVDTFTGDGSTVDFVTRAKYTAGKISVFVRVNGQRTTFQVLETDSSFAVPNRVAIRFNTAPAIDAVISICVYESASQSFSEVTQNEFTGDGSTATYQLSPTPFAQQPLTTNVIVKVGDNMLRSGWYKQFKVSALREYEIENWQIVPGSINSTDVRAFLNDVEMTSSQYRWNPGNSSVTLESGVGVVGDILDVFIDNGQYSVSDAGVLTLTNAPTQNTKVTAYQFSKHDIADIEREQADVIARLSITVNSDDYYQYNQLTNGVIYLRKPAVDAQYVWVSLNGEWLAPSVDYTVSNDQMRVLISRTVSQNDQIDVMHFSAPSFIGKFAYRQFKDMMNRTHFKRIGNDRQYFLANTLYWYDKEIVLKDATGITEPNITASLPGIVFIDGERIEYWIKDGNKLQQLRRGTYGTGVPTQHFADTEVHDQSGFQTVPYKDEFVSEVYTGADVSNNQLTISFTPTNANQFELFVGGKRMRKNSISQYNPANGQDSPEADDTVSAEFTVDGVNPVITFTNTPAANAKIVVIRKQGKIWQEGTDPLSQTDNDIARFIRQKEVAPPQ